MIWMYRYLIAIISAVLAFASPATLESRAVSFAADPSINAKGIFNAAKTGKQVLATFPTGSGNKVKIFGDWLKLIKGVPLIRFIADMDVDLHFQFRCPVRAFSLLLSTTTVIPLLAICLAQSGWPTTDLIWTPRCNQGPFLRHSRVILPSTKVQNKAQFAWCHHMQREDVLRDHGRHRVSVCNPPLLLRSQPLLR